MTTAADLDPPDVTVVGSANADLVVPVGRRPAGGETVLGGDLATVPGGKGANQAVAAARLGARVAFVGCVGDDAHGRLLRLSLGDAGVDTTHLRLATAPTGVALILVTPDGDNSIVVSPGANAALTAADVTVPAVATARVVVLQREVDAGVSLAAARHARGLVVLNLAPSGPVPHDLLRRTDVLVVNEHEAADLLGEPAHTPGSADGVDAAERLRALGPATVVVTLGGRGAVAVDVGGTHVAAAPRIDVVDTTGAGDSFTGALAWRLAVGDGIARALAVAVHVGSLAATRPGAQPSFPTRDELPSGLVDAAG